MRKIYNKYKEIINYLIIGVLTTFVSLITYYLLVFTLLNSNNKIELQIANILSWISCVIFAYITNRKYVFNSNEKNILKEIIKFSTSRLTTLFIDMGFMFVFVSILGLNDKIIKLIVQIVIIILNYIFSKIFVFKKK